MSTQAKHRDIPDLSHESALNSNPVHVTRPISFLNPTTIHYKLASSGAGDEGNVNSHSGSEDPAVAFKWSSRNNRKGRHALTVSSTSTHDNPISEIGLEVSSNKIAQGIWRMLTYYPIWNVSFDVAYLFTWGSIVWVINAMFALLPITNPSSEFPGETLYGGGISAFIGATIFEIGSIFLMIESLNESRTACFGWAVEEAFKGGSDSDNGKSSQNRIRPEKFCHHHHVNKQNLVGKAKTRPVDQATRLPEVDTTPPGARSWIWFPSWNEFRNHYLREIGFLACSSQMFGATIFWISGFTALPGIYNNLAPNLVTGVYWVPQIIGGTGFVVSGTLFMIETQQKWWKPAPGILGWWIGGWNLIGGIGFTLCPIFGLFPATWGQNQAAVSTFWGSWAFLIGSVIQWYESIDTHPVEKV